MRSSGSRTGQLDADVPPLVPRGDLRLLRDEHRWRELARLHAVHFRPGRAGDDLSAGKLCGLLRISSPISRISSRNMRRSSLGSKPRPRSPNGSNTIGGGAKQDRRLLRMQPLLLLYLGLPGPLVERRSLFGPRGAPAGLALASRQPGRGEPASNSITLKIRFGFIAATLFSTARAPVRKASIRARPSLKSRR